MDIYYQEALGLFFCAHRYWKKLAITFVQVGLYCMHFFLALEVGHLLHGGCLVHNILYSISKLHVLY